MEYLQYVWLLLLGLGAGAVGTLIGAGGGFILMPILLLTRPDETRASLTAYSLAMVCCSAFSGSYWYARMKRIDFKSGLLFLITGIPGAVAGRRLIWLIPPGAFNLAFGLVVILGGIYIFLRTFGDGSHKHGSKPTFKRSLIDADGVRYNYGYRLGLGMALSFLICLGSSMLGIGGGIIQVPAMVSLLNFPVHLATATSQFILAIVSAVVTTGSMFDGSLSRADVPELLALSAGAVVGARLGAHFSKRIHGRWIMRILAAGLSLVGAQVLMKAVAAMMKG